MRTRATLAVRLVTRVTRVTRVNIPKMLLNKQQKNTIYDTKHLLQKHLVGTTPN